MVRNREDENKEKLEDCPQGAGSVIGTMSAAVRSIIVVFAGSEESTAPLKSAAGIIAATASG